jgi:hypothetical protein
MCFSLVFLLLLIDPILQVPHIYGNISSDVGVINKAIYAISNFTANVNTKSLKLPQFS